MSGREKDSLYQEIAEMADLIAHWKFHAIWHRCKLTGRDPDNASDYRAAEAELELSRINENRERRGGAEAPREIGS